MTNLSLPMHQKNFLCYEFELLQGFLQLGDIGGQHDPHLRIIGDHRETLGGHIIPMLQNKR